MYYASSFRLFPAFVNMNAVYVKPLALLLVTAGTCAKVAELNIQKIHSQAHVAPWNANLHEWHKKAAIAYNTDPAHLDMMLGAFVANVSVGTPRSVFSHVHLLAACPRQRSIGSTTQRCRAGQFRSNPFKISEFVGISMV